MGLKSFMLVKKEKISLSILEMGPVDGEAWKKCASFESLATTVRRKMDLHSTADLVSVVSPELPIDVATVFM